MTALALEKARPISELGKTPLWCGLNGVANFVLPMFIDRCKQAGDWLKGDGSPWPTANLDSNNFPVSLPSGVTSGQFYLHQGDGTDSYANASVAGTCILTWTSGPPATSFTCGGGGVNTSSVTGTRQITLTITQMYNTTLSWAQFDTYGIPSNITCIKTTNQALYDAGEIYDPDFLSTIPTSLYAGTRFMDFMSTNFSQQTNWTDRPLPAWWSYSTAAGVPLEVMVALSNKIMLDPWFNMPHKSTNTYMINFFTYVKTNLNPALTPVYQYTNEFWNFGFGGPLGQWTYCQAQGVSIFGTNSGDEYLNFYGMRVAQMAKIADTVYGGNKHYLITLDGQGAYIDAHATIILTSPRWQTLDPTHYVAPYLVADMFSVALYWGGNDNRATIWDIYAASGQTAAAAEINAMTASQLPQIQGWAASWGAKLASYNIDYRSYEGGYSVDLVSNRNNNITYTILTVPNGTAFSVGELVTQGTTGANALVVSKTATSITLNTKATAVSAVFDGYHILTSPAVPAGQYQTVPLTVSNGNAYTVGETVTQATSGATGVVSSKGATSLAVNPTTATAFNTTNLVTGGTSGASQIPSGIGGPDTSVIKAGMQDTFNEAAYNTANGTQLAQNITNCRAAGMKYYNIFVAAGPTNKYGSWGTKRNATDNNARYTALVSYAAANPRDWMNVKRRRTVAWPP